HVSLAGASARRSRVRRPGRRERHGPDPFSLAAQRPAGSAQLTDPPTGANVIPPNTVVVPWGYGNICSNERGCDLPAPRQINTGCVCLTASDQQMGGIVRVMYVEGPTSPYLRPHQLQQPPR